MGKNHELPKKQSRMMPVGMKQTISSPDRLGIRRWNRGLDKRHRPHGLSGPSAGVRLVRQRPPFTMMEANSGKTGSGRELTGLIQGRCHKIFETRGKYAPSYSKPIMNWLLSPSTISGGFRHYRRPLVAPAADAPRSVPLPKKPDLPRACAYTDVSPKKPTVRPG